jgi:branched-chain amino acid transport system substrate-binding protein
MGAALRRHAGTGARRLAGTGARRLAGTGAGRRLAAATVVWALALALVAASCSSAAAPLRIGAVYPLSGGQGPGGVDEFRGVSLAADLANADGGVDGRTISLVPMDASGADAAPGAVAALARRGIRLVVGSYGSTISVPAAAEAARRGLLFWETGAVGLMPALTPASGRLTFRVAPSGPLLGRSAVSFVAERLAPLLHRRPTSLRFAVASVADAYGRTVAGGALAEIRRRNLTLAGRFDYDPRRLDAAALADRLAAVRPDVLFVASYLDDAVALRRAVIRRHIPLLAGIGTSSSYCMPAFGAALGRGAVGLFASDKPDEEVLDPSGLTSGGRAVMRRAMAAYRARYHAEMSAAALAGFSAGWALFHDVLPAAADLTPAGVSAAALRVRVPVGGLPNGSGIAFGRPGTPDAGANLLATSVIEEWVGVNRRAVVWPPRFATTAVRPLRIEA